MIFDNTTSPQNSRRHHSYDLASIIDILEYQKKNQLNNIQLANHFKLSRNTVAKWKKSFNDKVKPEFPW